MWQELREDEGTDAEALGMNIFAEDARNSN